MNLPLRELVRTRAASRCEYCQLPSQYAELPFEIDHIIAQKHHGRTLESNLVLSWFYCNSYKGPNIAGVDPESGKTTPLFHPRQDDWSEHFRWLEAELIGLSPEARATIDVLQINKLDAIRVRTSLIAEGVFPPLER